MLDFDTQSTEYVEEVGHWRNSADSGRFSRSRTAVAGWNVTVPTGGLYQAQIWVDTTTNSTAQAQFRVEPLNDALADGHSVTVDPHSVTFDQKATSGTWVDLGTYRWVDHQSYALRITNLDQKLLRAHRLRLTEVITLPVPTRAALLFDVNADGHWNQADIDTLETWIEDGRFIDPIFDVNNDGSVNPLDIRQLARDLNDSVN